MNRRYEEHRENIWEISDFGIVLIGGPMWSDFKQLGTPIVCRLIPPKLELFTEPQVERVADFQRAYFTKVRDNKGFTGFRLHDTKHYPSFCEEAA